MEGGRLPSTMSNDGMQSKIKEDKHKEVEKHAGLNEEQGHMHRCMYSCVVEMPINTLRHLTPTSLASILDTVDPALGQEVDYMTS